MFKQIRWELAYRTWVVVGLLVFSFFYAISVLPVRAETTAMVRYAAPGGLPNGNCDSWANACDMQTALAQAEAGDELWVQQGLHKPTSDPANRLAAFQLKNGVAIYGGFVGVETIRIERNWMTNLTILSGDIDNNDLTDPNGVVTSTDNINGTNSYHVVASSNVDHTAVLNGFIVTAGYATGSAPHNSGGGMFNDHGSPTLTNVIFYGNFSASQGGGMANFSGDPTFSAVTFWHNRAALNGGGLFNEDSNPILSNVIFSENTASDSGGGMFNLESSPAISDALFQGNSAGELGGGLHNQMNSHAVLAGVSFQYNSARYGGGIYNSQSNSTLSDSAFLENAATHSGGGIYNTQASPVLMDVSIENNRAENFGGGLYDSQSHTTLERVTFSDNFAGTYGGGMFLEYGDPPLKDVIFAGNQASYGGGLFNYSHSSPALRKVAFTENTAVWQGAGIYSHESAAILADVSFTGNLAGSHGGGMFNQTSQMVLVQVLFSGNKGSNGGAIYNTYSSVTLTNGTLAGNYATGEGGGIYNDNSGPYLQNSILWDNSSASGGNNLANGENSTPTIRYSLVGGCNPNSTWNNICGMDGGNNLPDANPLFTAPQPASSAPTISGNYRLLNSSPAINAGDNEADLDNPSGTSTDTVRSILVDLDGAPRFVRLVVDLGPYENQNLPCPTGGVLYVNRNAMGVQTGESWVNALVTLQDALQVSEACEIWVAEGVYYPDEGGSYEEDDRSATFQLKSGVALYGGFAGTETTRDQRDWEAHLTVLSGDLNGDDNSNVQWNEPTRSDNSSNVAVGATGATLDGFTITAGNADGVDNKFDGGGMYNISSNPTLENITFSNNSARYYGGGMYIENSSPMLTNITFHGNDAANSGGGVYNHTSNSIFTNITFIGNSANISGGGIHNVASSLLLTNVIFNSNSALYYGGGMNNGGNSVLTNVTFSGNSADEGGGMYSGGDPILTNVIFSDNSAGIGGGMINLYSSNPTLTNATFSNNHAVQGGGMANRYSSTPQIRNTIFWGNVASTGAQISNDTESYSVLDHTNIQGGCPTDSTCTHITDADPLFVDAATNDLRLRPRSPAIDAGNNAYITTVTDLAGEPRFVDIPGTPDTGAGTPPVVDLGAYEASFVDVGLIKTVSPLSAEPGATITYTLAFSNGGSLPATSVIITDIIPDFFTVQEVSFSGATITDTGQIPPYAWAVQNLFPGQSGQITLVGVLDDPLAAGLYPNNAVITAAQDADTSNHTSDASIQVLNAAPQSQSDSYTSLEDQPLIVPAPGVLLNDRDPNGDAFSAHLVDGPAHGTLSLNADGSFNYTPAPHYNGGDQFSYYASDGQLNSTHAIVELTITSVNDPPMGTDASLVTNEDTNAALQQSNFWFQDPYDIPPNNFNRLKVTTLPDKGTLTLNGAPLSAGQFVSVAELAAGEFIFSPAPNEYGDLYTYFTFQLEDDGGTANGGVNLDPTPNRLNIIVEPVNDAPLAISDDYIARQGFTLVIPAPGVLANDTDIDSPTLTAFLVEAPTHGNLTFNPDGSFTYISAPGYLGFDHFTYYASDGNLASNIATVTIDVQLSYNIHLPMVFKK